MKIDVISCQGNPDVQKCSAWNFIGYLVSFWHKCRESSGNDSCVNGCLRAEEKILYDVYQICNFFSRL